MAKQAFGDGVRPATGEEEEEEGEEWLEFHTPDGYAYYHRTRDGVTQWDRPTGPWARVVVVGREGEEGGGGGSGAGVTYLEEEEDGSCHYMCMSEREGAWTLDQSWLSEQDLLAARKVAQRFQGLQIR